MEEDPFVSSLESACLTMSASTSADEALKRAKAIAARLSGRPEDAESESTSSTGKRKRWGVMPEGPNGDAAASADPSVASKRLKEEDKAQKRVWIPTSEERPASHYVSYISRHLPSIIDDVRRAVGAESDDEVVSIRLEGRGASNKPPVPGMPEQPLHVMITGRKDAVQEAAPKMETLLLDAKEAPPEGSKEEDLNQSLAVIPPKLRAASSSSSYRPASVAQMIGQANMPPDLAGMAGGGEMTTYEMGVPHGVVGFIIGRGGENIAQMQARTGCKVQIQKESELKPGQTVRLITLQAASQSAIDACREQIESMVNERVRSMGGGLGGSGTKDAKVQDAIAAGHSHIQVEVPEEDVGLVIGKQGSTIKMIQDQTGASIQVPPSGSSSTTGIRIVHITHPSEQGALNAKQQVEDLLKSRPSYRNHGPQETIHIPVSSLREAIGEKDCKLTFLTYFLSFRLSRSPIKTLDSVSVDKGVSSAKCRTQRTLAFRSLRTPLPASFIVLLRLLGRKRAPSRCVE